MTPDGRIRSIDVRTITSSDAPAVGSLAREFTVRVWQEVDDALARARPGTVYRRREWRTRWSVTDDDLRSGATAPITSSLVRECLSLRPLEIDDPIAPSQDLVCFRSEPVRIARWLLARDQSTASRWPFTDLDAEPSADTVLAALITDDLTEVLWLLHERGQLGAAAASIDFGACVRLLDSAAGSTGRHGNERDNVSQRAQHRRGGQPRDAVTRRDTVVAALQSIVGGPRAALAGGAGPSPRGVSPPAGPGLGVSSTCGEPGDADPSTAAPGLGVSSTGGEPGDADPFEDRGVEWATADADGGRRATCWAGIAYLLRPLATCRVGSALWEACLPEAVIISDALASIAGADPIVEALAGAGEPPGPYVELGQLDLVRSEILDVVGKRCRERAHLARSGPMTLARLGDYGWPFAVWVDAPDDHCADELIGAGLDVTGGGGLVDIDLAGAGDRGAAVAGEPLTAALVAMVWGAPLTLLAHGLGAREVTVDDFVERWLRIDGQIVDERAGEDDVDDVRIVMPGAAIDIVMRRSGGDADPGWVPWLCRNVRLEFTVEDFD